MDWQDLFNKNKKLFIASTTLVILAIFACFIATTVSGAHSQELNRIKNEISTVQNEIKSVKAKQIKIDGEIKHQLTGVDSTRLDRDKKTIEEFLRVACTWDSLNAYESVYANISSEYPVEQNEKFYNFFINPSEFNSTFKQDNQRINMLFSNLKNDSIVLTKIDDKYSYFTEVVFTSQSNKGDSETGSFVFSCDVDKDGKISNMYASRTTK